MSLLFKYRFLLSPEKYTAFKKFLLYAIFNNRKKELVINGGIYQKVLFFYRPSPPPPANDFEQGMIPFPNK